MRMLLRKHVLRTSLILATAAICPAQGDLAKQLSFEAGQTGDTPSGWGGGPPGRLFADDKMAHGGQWSVRLEAKAGDPNGFTVLTRVLPMEAAGSMLTLRGWLKTEEVTDFAGLWMRQDGDAGPLAFDNMKSQQLKGTTDWKQYRIDLPLQKEGRQLYFGILVSASGKLWGDDLELLVDGKPIWEAPKVERPKTPLDTDHEFDGGSKVSVTELSKAQVENLALLGKVWGLLKYHHPAVTQGKRHWDYDLFRVLPAVLAASNRAEAAEAIRKWIGGLGEVAACSPCAKLDEANLHLRPDLDWIQDEGALGKELSTRLKSIVTNRPADGKQFYVSLFPGVGNPKFENEPAYGSVKLDTGYQLLGLYRFWNMVQYWFPYRDVIGENWNGVLTEFVPRVALARTRQAYELETMALIARVHDTHANLWSSLAVRPPVGDCTVAVQMRFVEGQAVVASTAEEEKSLQRGDVVTEIDGEAVSKLVDRWRPYYAASNEPTRLRDIGRSMMRGACGGTALKVRRGSEAVDVAAQRVKPPREGFGPRWHDRPGDAFQILEGNIAYLKLSAVKAADAAEYVKRANETKGWVIDVRNYPSEFMPFALGQLLVEKPSDFVIFTVGDLVNPGAFRWGTKLTLTPQEPAYKGRIMILVDEVTQSSAEYTTMALSTAPRATVIGSTTAAADGNVSQIPLPGGLRSMVSGIGVFYPDKRPTQRVGIVPEVEAKPTIQGIRDGRDEVLEEAVRRLLRQ